MSDLLVAHNLYKSYGSGETKVEVLKGLSLTVKRGESLVIVGASGVGKSTLLHLLGSLDKPNLGSIHFDGQDITKLKEAELAKLRNKKMGFIFQFYHLLPEFSALENVIIPCLLNGGGGKEALKRGERLLRDMGLEKRIHHKPHQLSGGEQQRVAISRALVNEPWVVFADEPTGNLDSASAQGVADLLFQIPQDGERALLLVTHNEALASRAQKILQMTEGRLLEV